jgi:hypothetical protein
MRSFRFLAAIAAFFLASVALAVTLTNETLVLTTATALPQTSLRTAIEIQNLGPNPIYCALGTSTGLAVGKGRQIAANGGVWQVRLSSLIPIYCLSSANQVTTAATITTELR